MVKRDTIYHMMSLGAPIVTFEEIDAMRDNLGKIVMVSGGFDPIHPGHISNIQEAKKLGDTLVVIVNGDNFLTTKKGKPFQDLATRSAIVSAVQGVDYVIPFEIENDQSVSVALQKLRPHIFAKGGDRTSNNIPEAQPAKELGIEIVYGIGADKQWSSSDFLAEWVEHKRGASTT